MRNKRPMTQDSFLFLEGKASALTVASPWNSCNGETGVSQYLRVKKNTPRNGQHPLKNKHESQATLDFVNKECVDLSCLLLPTCSGPCSSSASTVTLTSPGSLKVDGVIWLVAGHCQNYITLVQLDTWTPSIRSVS